MNMSNTGDLVVVVVVCVFPVEKRLREATQFGVEGSNVFLECQPRSPQASVKWLLQKDGRRKIVSRTRNTSSITSISGTRSISHSAQTQFTG